MHGQMIESQVRELAPGRATTAKFMGWRPDLPDARDFMYAAANPDRVEMSGFPVRTADQRIFKQPVFDQGPRGSCTGQSTAVLHAIERVVTPRSALFVYWHARALIGETQYDNGAYIRDAIKITNIEGVPRDDLWPDDHEHLHPEPSAKADKDADKRRIFNYYRLDADPGVHVDRGQAYRACLASGHAFVIGFTVYENFWQTGYNGGVAPMPGGRPDGGHAVLVYGYDDDFRASAYGQELARRGIAVPEKVYKVRNSWGGDWGYNGDFVIPTAFLENPFLADDCWTLRRK
jgi:hypothetical protein